LKRSKPMPVICFMTLVLNRIVTEMQVIKDHVIA
jgi:hypothetical protein